MSETRRMVVDIARRVAREKIEPIASHLDRKEEFPLSVFREMGGLGLLGIPYPQEYGGAGLDHRTHFAVIVEIARACASTAMSLLAHTTLTGYPIFLFGSESQKRQFLSRLATGESIGAYGLTESVAGSDISSIQTSAVRKGDCYILNGTKVFITNANYADIFTVAAMTAPGRGAMGMSVFVLDKDIPGFRVSGKREEKLGMRASDTGELLFEDAEVPAANLIGRENFGLKVLHEALVSARVGMASIALGLSLAAQERCLEHVAQRKQFGKPLSRFQTIKNMMADMEMHISAARLLIEKAAEMKDRGESITKEASEAKLFASEMATKVTKDAVQIFGGYGYSRELPLERYFRDAKLTEIGDGTSEIQRLIIAEEVFRRS